MLFVINVQFFFVTYIS